MPLSNKQIKLLILQYETTIRRMNEGKLTYDHDKKLKLQREIKQLKAQKQSLCQTPSQIHSTT
jgi:hypothetical protein